jgi:hypothetical protein
VYLQ